MISGVSKLLAVWISLESTASFIIFFATALLFSHVFLRLWNDDSLVSSKITRFGIAILNGFIFIGIVGSFYFLLSSSYKVFYTSAMPLLNGEDVREKAKELRRNWGGAITQEHMNVSQTISRVDVIKIIQADGTDAYLNRTVIELVEQESIIGFEGDINLHLVDPQFNTYKIDATYKYNVANQTEFVTLARFGFAIGTGRSFSKLLVFVDDREIGSAKTLNNGVVNWELTLLPGQHVNLQVDYSTQGMDSYSYKIPSRKPIQDFALTLVSDSRNIYSITQPETTAIRYENELTDSGYKLFWTIDNSILEPKLGVRYSSSISPDHNQKTAILLLKHIPRGGMLLATTVLFTLIICGLYVDLWKFFMFISIFSANFLLLMGLDLVKINNQAVLPLSGLFSLGMIYWVYRKLPLLPLMLITIVSALFLFGYPYAGLIEKDTQYNAFDSIVQAVIILYIFCLSLYIRVWRKNV